MSMIYYKNKVTTQIIINPIQNPNAKFPNKNPIVEQRTNRAIGRTF